MSKNNIVNKLLLKYEPLCKQYASKVFNFERFGYEREDIVQEMRIKLYKSLLGYGKRWKEYRTTGKYKPIPMEFWVRRTLSNKVIDFIKLFNKETVSNIDKVSLSGGVDSIDIGEHNTSEFEIDIENGICTLNGVDIVEGLRDDKKQCYMLHLCGFTNRELSKHFDEFDIPTFISGHSAYISNTKKAELLDFKSDFYQVVNFAEE